MEKLECIRKIRMGKGHDRRYMGAHTCKEDDLFLSIADGDFAFSEIISQKVSELVKSRNLSYEFLEEDNSKKIIKYYKNHYQLNITNNEILFGNGVLYWIQVAIHALTHHGDSIIIQPPVYDPFAKIITKANRKIIEAPLEFKNNKFVINFQELEKAFKLGRLFILCSPHNPTGNVWSKTDLIKIMKLAKKNNVYVVADEIWQDVVFQEEFTSVLHLNNFYENIIHVSSPVKTFNLGGLQFGITIIKDLKLNNIINKYSNSVIEYSSSQPWVSQAVQTVYGNTKVWNWFTKYIAQIKKNHQLITKLFEKFNITYSKSEATYLIFVKLGSDNLKGIKLDKKLKSYGLHLGMGHIYGTKYEKWARINIAICDNSTNILIAKLTNFLEENKHN